MKDFISAGVDEAGRGPVIGPLILACAVFDKVGWEKIAELKVRDSKKVSPKRRAILEPQIKEIAVEWKISAISAQDIDRLRKKMSLNLVEARYTAKLILSCETRMDRLYIDATDSIAQNYHKRIKDSLIEFNKDYVIPELVVEHKADDKYFEASAASILAKVERDRRIEDIKKEVGEFGSGYPSDPLTQDFIKELKKTGEYPDFIRKSWSTISREQQTNLSNF